jgi:ribosomal-protein-serine acetyltransferase
MKEKMEIIITEEILLRLLAPSDAGDIFHTIDTQRDYLGKWLPFVPFTLNPEDSRKFVETVVNAPKERFEYVFTIRKEGRFAGLIGFKETDRGNRKTEIGYWLSKPYQKQGIITQSVERLCDFAFNELKMNRIQIRCAVENIPSRKIPERLGFHLEGIEREGELLSGNVFTDLAVYSKLRSEH